MVCQRKQFAPLVLAILALAVSGFAIEPDQVAGDLSQAQKKFMQMAPRGNPGAFAQTFASVPGIDSLSVFTGDFRADGVDPFGNHQNQWFYYMVGNQPRNGGTTTINAPIVPVVVELLDFDGSIRVVNGQKLHYDPTQFVNPVLKSPVFSKSTYTSSNVPTQVTDAVQRAEFFNVMKQNWHTLLKPSVKHKRSMRVPRGTYLFALNGDGSCCAFVLIEANTFVNLLFPTVPTDTTTPIGAAENAGDITTKDMSTFLFPNTYLFIGDPSNCCILGFHSYDFEPGDEGNGFAERRFVMNYSSWISPGLFGGGFEDITALSHEVAETYNDPWVASDGVHNITPWWRSDGQCQDVMEDGDVIEGLADATFPITMNGMTYHPQNEALLQWFEFQSPSTAIANAYSYPDVTTLTALSPPQGVNCQ